MKLIATIIFLLIASSVSSQGFKTPKAPLPKDTIKSKAYRDSMQADSMMRSMQPAIEENITEDPPPEIMDIGSYKEITAAEGPDYYELPAFNQFNNRKDIKVEEKPDKKASYSGGTGVMFTSLQELVSVPYSYKNGDDYVLVQFVVGKDSLLYNPLTLTSPGSSYSVSATSAIERLPLRFNPATKNGVPVNSIIIIPVRFVHIRNNDY